MTLRALQVAAMVERLVGQPTVHVDVRQPRGWIVTHAAILPGDEVSLILAGSSNAVVTGRARTEHLGVINGHCGYEGCRAVAIFTDIGCQDMLRPLADGVDTVVA